MVRKGMSSSNTAQPARSLQMARQRWQDEPFVLKSHVDEITGGIHFKRLLI